MKRALKILEQNAVNKKNESEMYVLKTKPLELSILSESKANNKSNDENRTRWLKEEKERKKTIDGDRNNGPSK